MSIHAVRPDATCIPSNSSLVPTTNPSLPLFVLRKDSYVIHIEYHLIKGLQAHLASGDSLSVDVVPPFPNLTRLSSTQITALASSLPSYSVRIARVGKDHLKVYLLPKLLGGCWSCFKLWWGAPEKEKGYSEKPPANEALPSTYLLSDAPDVFEEVQGDALRWSKQISQTLEQGDRAGVLEGIQKLQECSVLKIPNPLHVLQNLLEALISNKGDWISGGIKTEIAQLVELFAFTTCLIAIEKPLLPSTKKALEEHIDQACDHINQDPYYSNPLRFHLECAKTAIGTLSHTVEFRASDVLSWVGAIVLAGAKISSNPLGLKLEGLIKAIFKKLQNLIACKLFYEKIILIYGGWWIFEKAATHGDSASMQAVTECLVRHLERAVEENGNWKVIYACLEVLKKIVLSEAPDQSLFPAFAAIKKLHAFNEFWFVDNWRVRDKVVRSCIEIASRCSNTQIREEAQNLLLDRRIKESSPKVQAILTNPERAIAMQNLLKQAWARKKGEVEQMLTAQAQLLQKMSEDLQTKPEEFQALREEVKLQFRHLEEMNKEIGQEIAPMVQRLKKIFLTPEETLQQMRTFILNDPITSELAYTYIPAAVSRSCAGKREGLDLMKEIANFLAHDEHQVLLLVGDGGSGKTSFTRMLQNESWKNWKDGERVPLRVDLPSLQKPYQTAIEEVLARNGFKLEQLPYLKANYRFLFIFDAFDEIPGLNNLYMSNRLYEWPGSKLVITCRGEKFMREQDHARYFAPINRDRGVVLRSQFRELYIDPFSGDNVRLYLQKYLQMQANMDGMSVEERKGDDNWRQAETYEKYIRLIPGLSSWAGSPFLLWIIVQALPVIMTRHSLDDVQQRAVIKQRLLYETVINMWFSREEAKLLEKGENFSNGDAIERFHQFCKDLSREMYAKEKTQICYTGPSSEWHKFFRNDDPDLVKARRAAPLIQTGPGTWAFRHEEFRKYFLTLAGKL